MTWVETETAVVRKALITLEKKLGLEGLIVYKPHKRLDLYYNELTGFELEYEGQRLAIQFTIPPLTDPVYKLQCVVLSLTVSSKKVLLDHAFEVPREKLQFPDSLFSLISNTCVKALQPTERMSWAWQTLERALTASKSVRDVPASLKDLQTWVSKNAHPLNEFDLWPGTVQQRGWLLAYYILVHAKTPAAAINQLSEFSMILNRFAENQASLRNLGILPASQFKIGADFLGGKPLSMTYPEIQRLRYLSEILIQCSDSIVALKPLLQTPSYG